MIATRYAKALFAHAQKHQSTEELKANMHTIIKLCQKHPSFTNLLQNPVIRSTHKETVCAKYLFLQLHPTTVNFIKIIIKHHRENQLLAIANHFLLLDEQAKKQKQVSITFAHEPSQESIEKITALAKKIFHIHNTIPVIHIDPTILGGCILQVGDHYLDASIAKRLQALAYFWQQNTIV